MSKPVTTADPVAAQVAEQAYQIVRICRESEGATNLPEWSQIPGVKQTFLTNAARGALEGKEVWDVWALSCGEEPTEATAPLWRQKPSVLQLLPKVYESLGKAVALHTTGKIPAHSDLLEDAVPSFFEEETGDKKEKDTEEPVAASTSGS
jgi:hypothetical protein